MASIRSDASKPHRSGEPVLREQPRAALRIGLALGLAVGVLAVGITMPTTGTGRTIDLAGANELAKGERGLPHVDPAGTPAHSHNDPATKNAVSRGSTVGDGAVDPTTDAQRVTSEAYVESERKLADPQLRATRVREKRTAVPADRYAMAGGCYSLQAPNGSYLKADGTAVSLVRVSGKNGKGAPGFYFKATRLGGYLLHTKAGQLTGTDDGVSIVADPSEDADWTVRGKKGRFRLAVPDGSLRVAGSTLAVGSADRFRLRRTGGCASYPEAQVNVSGRPHGGVTEFQEVRGYVDAHTHGMAFEFLGGDLHCGRPWHEYGAPYALPDCAEDPVKGAGTAAVESFLSGEAQLDPVGWPTFNDWPAPDALAHEGTYWKWLERSWRGGQRLFVNLLVENNQLCMLYPVKRNSCDDMDSIRLQARDMYKMQDYIDAQYGGPGEGFYRIVKNPFQARKVINAGKMAVVMGVETSIPFGCTFKTVAGNDVPACDEAEIDASLDELHRMGVRQMELVNKFDNALAGVAGDAGATGVLVNSANFLETGSFWRMEHCEPADGESADNPQLALPDISAGQQDALFGAVGQLFGGVLPAVPLYGTPAHCNKRGLTDLGVHTIEALAKRQIVFDPDHLSVKARSSSMDVIDDLDYPGVISSHSWSTPDTYPRIYDAGGFITPYAGDSTGFVAKWRRHLGWANKHYYFGMGFGADINGLGAQGNPRGADVSNPVRYPIKGLGGVRISKQKAGERTWDINIDGVAQYGLYPDWIEDLRQVAEAEHAGDGAKIVEDMTRGAEAYLQMWERTYGVAPDSCRNPGERMSLKKLRAAVRTGMSVVAVLRKVGQPYQRLGTTYQVCAKKKGKKKVPMTIRFSRNGRVVGLTRS